MKSTYTLKMNEALQSTLLTAVDYAVKIEECIEQF